MMYSDQALSIKVAGSLKLSTKSQLEKLIINLLTNLLNL